MPRPRCAAAVVRPLALVAGLVVALLPGGLQGATAASPVGGECNDETFIRGQLPDLGTALVIGRGSVPLFTGEPGCRDLQGSGCRGPSLVPGDLVLVGRRSGTWICCWSPSAGGEVKSGWLPAGSLEVESAPASPPIDAWTGNWTLGYNTLAVTVAGDGSGLTVDGVALWTPGGSEPIPNTGQVSGTARPEGYRLVIDDPPCRLELFLVDDSMLFARDNHRCGGLNVTFTGIYY